jgi:Leucine-rich repeat (LRR) protein
MKKLYTLLVVALIGFVGKAQIVNIPDANFKAKLLSANATNFIASTQTPDANGQYSTCNSIDINSDGEIQVSEALAIKCLVVQNTQTSNLTGLEAFTNIILLNLQNNTLLTSFNTTGFSNLKWLSLSNCSITSLTLANSSILYHLDCRNNNLTSFNISVLPNLNFLDCSDNLFTSIDVTSLSQLKTLECGSNQLTSLNLTGLTLMNTLGCSLNQLTSLNISALHLTSLNCGSNQLTSLNLSGQTGLRALYCNANQLTALNLSGLTAIRTLYCQGNQIPSLSLSGLLLLTTLYCDGNQISTLSLSGLSSLQTLNCSSNLLTSLNLTPVSQLRYLSCGSNQISTLSVNNLTQLTFLECSNTLITSLTVSNLTLLQQLYFANNQISSINLTGLTALRTLDFSGTQIPSMNIGIFPQLTFLYCNNTQITTIDGRSNSILNFIEANNCPNLTSIYVKNGYFNTNEFSNCPNMQYLCTDENEVTINQNLITTYGYTNCSVSSYCSFVPGGTFYTIQGNNRYDSNTNGCDASDNNLPNLKFAITNGTTSGTFISNTSGSYTIPVQAGTHTVMPILENPTYFTVTSSNTGNIVFPTATSPYVRDFCVTPNGIKNDLEVTIIPIEVARPGFDAFYKIIYKNKGNQVANGSLSFTFNDAIMDLVTASPIVNVTGTNSLSWNYANLNPFETREINLTFNVNSPMETPAVNGGDVLNYSATIVGATDETPNDNTFTLNQTVVNSYDPNDKTCLEGTTITPSMVGSYVHYVIRFENTGTFAAQNVVIKDMIDTTKFDMASLIPQSSSHPFVTRITNTNQVEFIFENINLPFDDATNDGYVAFKIKTKPTLVLGNTFTNTASIYFDYNFPIVTNTTTTTVATLGNQDFDFGSVFTLSPVPAKDVLTIKTKQTVVVSSINIYNTLGQLVQVNTNPNETIDVSGLQSGSYFVRITSDKGSATGKFLKE